VFCGGQANAQRRREKGTSGGGGDLGKGEKKKGGIAKKRIWQGKGGKFEFGLKTPAMEEGGVESKNRNLWGKTAGRKKDDHPGSSIKTRAESDGENGLSAPRRRRGGAKGRQAGKRKGVWAKGRASRSMKGLRKKSLEKRNLPCAGE